VDVNVIVLIGATLIVALPAWVCEQDVVLASWTLIRLYVNIPAVVVGTPNVILLPDVVVTVRLLPPLIL
jgi:hypothetical protein